MRWFRRRPRPEPRHRARAGHVDPQAVATAQRAARHRLDPPTEPGLLAATGPDAEATVRLVAVPSGERSGRHSVRAITSAREPSGVRTMQLHAIPRPTR